MLGTILSADSAEGEWTRKTDMPTARFGLSIAEVDGRLFAIGGSDPNNRLATVEEYHPSTDEWSPRADMPTARKNTAAAVVDGIIYVFGGTRDHGSGSVRTTEAYDPATDTWTTKKDMPTARLGLAAVTLDGRIYAIGGYGVSAFESAVEVYDPATDTWEEKARLPIAYGNFGFARFNGKIYLFGGNTTAGPRMDTREYDPVTDSWTSKAAMPIARVYPSASVLNGRIHVLGSARAPATQSPATSRVDVYDPVTDTWEQGASMATARGDLASATVNGKIYAVGGLTGITWGDPGTVYATVEEFAFPADAEAYLTIQKSVLLSWKMSSMDHVVESALSPEGPWMEVTEFESQIVDDEIHMTVIQQGEGHFFRLVSAPLE